MILHTKSTKRGTVSPWNQSMSIRRIRSDHSSITMLGRKKMADEFVLNVENFVRLPRLIKQSCGRETKFDAVLETSLVFRRLGVFRYDDESGSPTNLA